MMQKCRTNLVLTVLGAAMLLQTVSAASKVTFKSGGWYRVPAKIVHKDIKETSNSPTVDYPKIKDDVVKFHAGIFYVVNVMLSGRDGIKMQIVYHKQDQVQGINASEKKVLEEKCEEVLTPESMEKVLHKAETHSSLAKYLSENTNHFTCSYMDTQWEKLSSLHMFLLGNQTAFHKVHNKWGKLNSLLELLQKSGNQQWEACNSLAGFLTAPANRTAFNKDTQWEACKTLLEFKAKGKDCTFGIGDWIKASGNSGTFGKDYYSEGDVGKIVDIHIKPKNSRFRFVVAWKRGEQFETGSYQGKKKKPLKHEKFGKIIKEDWTLEDAYQKFIRKRRRRLLPIERLLKDIERAQRTA